MESNRLKRRIEAAGKRIPADLVIKNGTIIDVFNLELIKGDIAVIDGFIAGIGEYEGKETIDAAGKVIAPAFIDGHVHIESSMVTPREFSQVLLSHGVTTAVTDPHEIANVSGSEGIQFMLDQSENLPLDVRVMLPSSVPATVFENSGAVLHAQHLQPFLEHPRVLGLAEVMDYPAVFQAKPEMLDKLTMTAKKSIHIDGHGAGLNETGINVYRSALIRTDHECTTKEEALDRLRKGMYLLIREGSVAKDLKNLITAVTPFNARRCLFCTDDKHLDDLMSEGSIDHNVRLAIQEGLDPLLAYQMASLNAAECYGILDKGAIAPGYQADFLLLDDLESVKIAAVYQAGTLAAKEGIYVRKEVPQTHPPVSLMETVNMKEVTEKDLNIVLHDAASAHIIEIIPNQLVTIKRVAPVPVENDVFAPSVSEDLLKIAVVERHRKTGNIGLSIVKGLSIQNGAIASTVAHDSHNLVVAGTNDLDMIVAIRAIEQMNGGYVIVKNGEVLASVPLPIAGLMSDLPAEEVNEQIIELKKKLKELGFNRSFDPFLTLSFLTLPVIPELKLTDLGLFDFRSFQHIDIRA